MDSTLGNKELVALFEAAISKIRANIKELTALDSAIGDGDHGVTMGRAVDAVEKAIGESDGSDIKTLLHNIGWGVMCIDGGSTGPLLGALFMGMSEGAADLKELDCEALAVVFEAGLSGVKKHSKARPGDKTMMDALDPAVAAIRAACSEGKTIPRALSQGAVAADKGARATKEFIARFGRAKNLGHRTLGCQDPGATSISLIFGGFADAL